MAEYDELKKELEKMINNKVILITGGTGSFGNELVKYLLKFFKPKKIIIFSRDEYKQDVMRANFTSKQNKIIRYLLGDVRDLEIKDGDARSRHSCSRSCFKASSSSRI